MSSLPSDVIPNFVGPNQFELREIEQEVDAELVKGVYNGSESEDEDGYQELEEDDLDMGLVEYIDTLALTDANNN